MLEIKVLLVFQFSFLAAPGMNLRILVVEVATENVSPPVSIRAEQGWTVMELKQEIGRVSS